MFFGGLGDLGDLGTRVINVTLVPNVPPKKTFKNPEICANAMIGLIKVASYLLSKQITQLERAFINEGGIRERMTKARVASKSNQQDQAKR